jgi:hypothetical protein
VGAATNTLPTALDGHREEATDVLAPTIRQSRLAPASNPVARHESQPGTRGRHVELQGTGPVLDVVG